MKNLILLFLFLIILSCSAESDDGCSVYVYYVYTYDDCSTCRDELCRTSHTITKEIYDCLKEALSESDESCLFVDNTVCSELDFEGYIREVVGKCLSDGDDGWF